MDMQHILKEYNLPTTGLIGIDKFVLKYPIKERAKIKQFLKEQSLSEITKKIPHKVIHMLKIVAPPNSYQVDIMFLPTFTKQNKGYNAILIFIEITSRKAFAYPLKTQKMSEIIPIYKKFIEQQKPYQIQSDDEFSAKEFLKVSLDNNIIVQTDVANNDHIIKGSDKLGIIDRFIYTLRGLLNKYFTIHNTTNWIDIYNDIINNYNSTTHSALYNKTPNEVFTNNLIGAKLHNTNLEQNEITKIITHEYKPGDSVRIVMKKDTFDKAQTRYSDEIYTIVEKVHNKYKVKNSKGEILKRMIKPSELLLTTGIVTQVENKAKNKVKAAKKEHQFDLKQKKEGIDTTKIVTDKTRPKNKIEKEEFIVEKITEDAIDKNTNRKIYKVYWQGYATPTWESYKNIKDTKAYEVYLNNR